MTKDMVNHERLAAVNAWSSIEHCPSSNNPTKQTVLNNSEQRTPILGTWLTICGRKVVQALEFDLPVFSRWQG